jgi:hypothetical protein
MTDQECVYTLARWDVVPGKEKEFVAAWSSLGQVFSDLVRPPAWGTLLRSQTEPLVFYSFGPWRCQHDIETMRSDPKAQDGFATLAALCTKMAPGNFDLIKHINLPAGET